MELENATGGQVTGVLNASFDMDASDLGKKRPPNPLHCPGLLADDLAGNLEDDGSHVAEILRDPAHRPPLAPLQGRCSIQMSYGASAVESGRCATF